MKENAMKELTDAEFDEWANSDAGYAAREAADRAVEKWFRKIPKTAKLIKKAPRWYRDGDQARDGIDIYVMPGGRKFAWHWSCEIWAPAQRPSEHGEWL